jgi:predicted SAM-dependent methyltransferase
MKLNFGCGNDYMKGWVNVDVKEDCPVDVIWDLNKFPYPFKNNTFDEVLISYVLEYLDNPIKVLKEIIRISKNKAKITIIVVHSLSFSAISQISFRNNFTENSFNGDRLNNVYGLKELSLMNVKLVFNHKWKRYIPFKKLFNSLYDKIEFELNVTKEQGE